MPITPAGEVEGKQCQICGEDATHIYGVMYVCCQCHQKSGAVEQIAEPDATFKVDIDAWPGTECPEVALHIKE